MTQNIQLNIPIAWELCGWFASNEKSRPPSSPKLRSAAVMVA